MATVEIQEVTVSVGIDSRNALFLRSKAIGDISAISNGQYLKWDTASSSFLPGTDLAGTVTSVALSVPSILSVSGSPITGAGTLAVTLATQAANLVFAGPTSGAVALPTMRLMVAADIPDISATYATLTGAQTLTNKTLTTPTIGSFANAGHSHLNSAGGGTITAAAISDLATAAVAFSNKTGNISQWTNDASYTTLAAVASGALAFTNKTGAISQWTNDSGYATTAAVASGYQPLDAELTTLASLTAVRGDLIIGSSAPAWSRLAKGAQHAIFGSDGTDIAWEAATGTGSPVRATSPTLVTPTLGVATATALGIGRVAVYPLDVAGTVRSAGTFASGSYQYGLMSDAEFSGTAQVNAIYGAGSIAAGVTVAERAGLRIDNIGLGAGAAVTTQYGIYIGSLTSGATNYAIWAAAGLNFFGNSVGIAQIPTHPLTLGPGTGLALYEAYTDGSNYSRFVLSTPVGGPITFTSSAAGSGTARAFSFVGGMVGIGLTPAATLDVNGTFRTSGDNYFNGNILARVGVNNDTATYLTIAGGTSGHTYLVGSVGIGLTGPAAKLDILDTTLAGSGSLAGSALNIAQTWNTTGAPTLFKANATNTASGAAMLMDLQVGGVSQFSVSKAGALAALGALGLLAGTAIPAGGTAGAGVKVSSTANFGLFFGSGAPTLAAAQGSLYMRSDGSTTITRAYINTDGNTTWTPLTTVG